MPRLLGGGLISLLLFSLWIYCIFDVIATESILIRNLPKTLWLLIVIVIPTVGSLAWLALGRPAYAGWRPGDTQSRPVRRVLGPDDDSRFLGPSPSPPPQPVPDEDRLRDWEADLRRREADLRRRENDPPHSSPPGEAGQ